MIWEFPFPRYEGLESWSHRSTCLGFLCQWENLSFPIFRGTPQVLLHKIGSQPLPGVVRTHSYETTGNICFAQWRGSAVLGYIPAHSRSSDQLYFAMSVYTLCHIKTITKISCCVLLCIALHPQSPKFIENLGRKNSYDWSHVWRRKDFLVTLDALNVLGPIEKS